MKTTFLFLFSLFCLAGLSQPPEKIYGNARQHKPFSYYEEQAVAWKKVVDKNPKDANAWYNYYYVNRNLMYNDTVPASAKERSRKLDKLVEDMGKQIPESYEYNVSVWQLHGNDPRYLSYLKKAAEMGEGRTEHLDFMINQGELTRTIKDREMYSKKKFDAGLFSSGIIYYNYNVLMGLEKNAILFTSGDNDTYPIWYLQTQGIRKDVTVINASLIQLDDYCDKLFMELGIEKWPVTKNLTEADQERYCAEIIKHIAANTKKYPVYIALSAACNEKYTQNIAANLYLTGLAYLYSNEAIDNTAILKNNVEHLYAFDYLDKPFYNEISPDVVKLVNGNYIIPLLKLYEHYKIAGDQQKADWTKSKLVAVSKGTENEGEVKNILQAH